MTNQIRERWRIKLHGVVQGVGMRPFVHHLATTASLVGEIKNDSEGVTIDVEGPTERLQEFYRQLRKGPPGSRIEKSSHETLAEVYDAEFIIADTCADASGISSPPPDRTTCDACLQEFNDPTNRRYLYPFVNCSDCGPRLSMLDRMPFDRKSTSMRDFPMCEECEQEYRDPNNRRFHAQATSCPKCGPRLQWHEKNKPEDFEDKAWKSARDKLAAGGVIAVKGIGGYQLMCDATNSSAVNRVRILKTRGEKPFALIAPSVEVVKKFSNGSIDEETILEGVERPIVILSKSSVSIDSPIAESVSPGTDTLGFQLPCTPLHHLLMNHKPYVLTSANISGDPLVIDDHEAFEKLLPVCDGILTHNRRIVIRCDDSVVKFQNNRLSMIRRSRGFSTHSIDLPEDGPTVLAIGGDGKSSLALAIGKKAFLSAHVGDVRNWEGINALRSASDHFCKLFNTIPDAIACDAHPGNFTNQWAHEYSKKTGIPCVPIFHHHAHAESLRLDAGVSREPFLAVCLDGTGFGPDGTIWGGEFLLLNDAGYERVASLKSVPLPGGDLAVEHPARMALSHLWAGGIAWQEDLPSVSALSSAEKNILRQQLVKGINCPPTSSMGRLFDAVASLIGLRHSVTYEAQAAIELESIADESCLGGYEWDLSNQQAIMIDTAPMFAGIIQDLKALAPQSQMAGRFHATVADMVCSIAQLIRSSHGVKRIGLTGGVCQNSKLVHRISTSLSASGLEIVLHRQVPCNDGGLALGQVMLARRKIESWAKPLE